MRPPPSLSHFCPLSLLLLMTLSPKIVATTVTVTSDKSTTDSQNILFFVGMGSHSHRTALEPLAHKLVEQGHNVTFLTPIKPTKENPKFTEFSPKGLTDFYYNVVSALGDVYFPGRLQDKYYRPTPTPLIVHEFEEVTCSLIFQSPEFKPWLQKAKFDLVILEHSGNKCGYALAYKLNAPVILFSAHILLSHEEDTFGFPVETSWLPNFALANTYTKERTFYDKFYGTCYRLYSMMYTNWIGLPPIDEIVRTALELPQMPSIVELEKEMTSLMFINTHFSNDYARSLPPFVVPVGGMHCNEDAKKNSLPKNLKDFIDGAGEDGFIFVSFGTIISMSKMPTELHDTLFKVVESRKTRFLWKWDTEPPANLPKNVLVAKWFPQQELLAHPKIKAFITHGGMMSTQQAIYFGVPTIVVPVLFDQPYNAQVMEHHGMGIHLELAEMNEKFEETITAILEDPRYASNAKLVSQRFRDRPMSPVDIALWWTNYIMRHKNDTSHLKPLGIHQSWWERRLLDVWFLVFAVILSLIVILLKLLKFIAVQLLSGSKVQKMKTK